MRTILKLTVLPAAFFASLGLVGANATESDANLSGTYGFKFEGFDNYATKAWIVGTGEFVANGKGAITGGSITYNDGGNVCVGNLLRTAYNIVADGEGTLTIAFSPVSGSCPVNPSFTFAIALALPNTAAIATLVQMSTTAAAINTSNQTAIMIAGDAHIL